MASRHILEEGNMRMSRITALEKSRQAGKLELALNKIEQELIELEQFPGEWSTQQELRHEELLVERRCMEAQFSELVGELA